MMAILNSQIVFYIQFFFHKLISRGSDNMDPCILWVFLCAINGGTFPRWICCHGFFFPLLFSLAYFPFYCSLLLEGININEFHSVVCTPLLTW